MPEKEEVAAMMQLNPRSLNMLLEIENTVAKSKQEYGDCRIIAYR